MSTSVNETHGLKLSEQVPEDVLRCWWIPRTMIDTSVVFFRLEHLQHNMVNTSWSLFCLLMEISMKRHTTNPTWCIDRREGTSQVQMSPMLPQVTDCLTMLPACNRRLSDFSATTPFISHLHFLKDGNKSFKLELR